MIGTIQTMVSAAMAEAAIASQTTAIGPVESHFQTLGAIFAALLGLAFGSFLNVCLSRLPEGENIAVPGSHCRHCAHVLAWWENLPLLSWILLRGRCRSCRSWIGVRYPLVELAVGFLWSACWLRFSPLLLTIPPSMMASSHSLAQALIPLIGNCVFCWLLVALAVLDAEQFWLPDWLTLPGVGLGIAFALLQTWSVSLSGKHAPLVWWASELWSRTLEVLMAAGVVLIIRLSYWLVRRREGMGLGDAKLMAMLGAWLGLIGAVESFAIAVLAASATALVWLIILALRRTASNWTQIPLPLGTFLCLAALSQDFYPDWLWLGWTHIFLR